jgi:hypothetical protein
VRVKAGISLPAEPGGGWLPDGSRMTWLNAPSGQKQDRLPIRAAEHNAVLPCGDGEEVSETCTLITTLLDHQPASAAAVREAYLTRWSASETQGSGVFRTYPVLCSMRWWGRYCAGCRHGHAT